MVAHVIPDMQVDVEPSACQLSAARVVSPCAAAGASANAASAETSAAPMPRRYRADGVALTTSRSPPSATAPATMAEALTIGGARHASDAASAPQDASPAVAETNSVVAERPHVPSHDPSYKNATSNHTRLISPRTPPAVASTGRRACAPATTGTAARASAATAASMTRTCEIVRLDAAARMLATLTRLRDLRQRRSRWSP